MVSNFLDNFGVALLKSIFLALALHGWQDNCGTFDKLIPLLPDHYYVVAIDFPGHGWSSHLPKGTFYNDTMFVLQVERVIQFLGWKHRPFTILGHSMGAAIGLLSIILLLRPEKTKNSASSGQAIVPRIIALDMIKPLTFPSEKLAAKMREGIQSFLDIEAKCCSLNGQVTNGQASSVPLYDHKQAVEKLIHGHSVFGVLTTEAAETLLKRGCKQAEDQPDKVYFTRDNRLKAMLFQRMDPDSMLSYFHDLHCDMLIIKADKGVKLDPDDISNRFIDMYRKQCRHFEYTKVAGGHHVHLCNPENVHQIIIDFMDKSGKLEHVNGVNHS